MDRFENNHFSRRERQILDIVYRLGQATAQEVLENLPDPPSYSAVRALMATLERKKMVKHTKEGRRYLYQPAMAEDAAKRSALQNIMGTFFGGKPENLVAALLDPKDQQLSDEEIQSIRSLIDKH